MSSTHTYYKTLFLNILIFLSSCNSQRPCVKWGNTFDVSLESKNLIRECNLPDGRLICCAAIANYTLGVETRGVGDEYFPSKAEIALQRQARMKETGRPICKVQKEYFSSPLEIRDIEKSKEIQLIQEIETSTNRLKALLDYVTSAETIKNSTIWLERVKLHMSSPTTPKITKDDYEFLSRFEFTRTCVDRNENKVETKWVEWIEPISITARHPFGFGKCRNTGTHFTRGVPRAGRSDVDYVLLQSGAALYNQTHTAGGRVLSESRRRKGSAKHYMFDAGTSTFDSSLFWFTCAYSQRKVSFDQVFGWEMTLLEPTDYWRRVPAKWKPFWHFHNIPITSGLNDADSPLRYIQQIASEEDFVAFKLDIDHPDMEMPVVLSLFNNPKIISLVDEFFFELHFQCEVMTSCGWGKRVPKESHGLTLDRPHVLDFFLQLRKKGLRAHIWP